jgi:hypothetical protein
MLVTPLPQAFLPLQVTVHELPEQLMEPPHDPDSAHVMSQPVALAQSTPPAHPFCPQVIRQGMEDGHVTNDPQAPAALQSIVHVPPA